MNWTPLCIHSHYSLCRALPKPKQIIQRCNELGYTSAAITDDESISGAVQFYKEAIKAEIKPILGCKFTDFTLLCEDLNGWKTLLKLITWFNKNNLEFNLENMPYQVKNLIVISGRVGSNIAETMFTEPKLAYNALEDIKQYIQPDVEQRVYDLYKKYTEIFGLYNIYLEVQLHDLENIPCQQVITDIIRDVCRNAQIPKVATTNPHYASPEDVDDHRLLLAVGESKKLSEIQRQSGYFKSGNYYIHSQKEIESLRFTQDEIANTEIISDRCQEYDILHNPSLPEFKCPEDKLEIDYLKHLCRIGWQDKLIGKDKIYIERIKKELDVIEGAGLAGYFLIVHDYVKAAKNRGELLGPGRGSAAGCLISYLLDITTIDPIRYDLIFERFYNAGRNTKDRVSLPDIDIDFEVEKREDTIQYIRDKYGHAHVAQMITFGRLMGRGALKEVLRVHDACSFSEMNKITMALPQDASISDELELMRQQNREPSIIQWTLENRPKDLEEWCHIDKKGNYQGPFAKLFAQAARMEGTFKSAAKHAAGLIISKNPIEEVAPLVKDKSSDELISGFEMDDAESVGLVKFDLLGIAMLDKLRGVEKLYEKLNEN